MTGSIPHHVSSSSSHRHRRCRYERILSFREWMIITLFLLFGTTTTMVTSFTPSTSSKKVITTWNHASSSSSSLSSSSSSSASYFNRNDDDDDDDRREDKDKDRRLERNQSLRVAANELKRKRNQAANLQVVDELFSANILVQENKRQNSNYVVQQPLNEGQQRPLVDLNLMGRGVVGDLIRPERSIGNQGIGKYQPVEPIRCLFLTLPRESETMIDTYLQQRYPKDYSSSSNTNPTTTTAKAIPIPIPLTQEESRALKLVSFAFRGRPVSKSVFLPLATILTNRDGALWDNLPWTTWTIDPERRNVDADGKAIDQKYLLGKRDAYNRMIGKDWYGRSLSSGNTAARLKYTVEDYYDEWLENRNTTTATNEEESSAAAAAAGTNFAFDESSLAYRILQLQVEESKSELAGAERNYAMIKARHNLLEVESVEDDILFDNYNEINSAVQGVTTALEQRTSTEASLQAFITKANSTEDDAQTKTELETMVNDFLTDLVSIQYLNNNKDDQTTTTTTTTAATTEGILDTMKQTISDKVSSLPEVNPTALEEARMAAQAFVTTLQYSNSSSSSATNSTTTNIMDDLSVILNRENYNLVTSVKTTVSGFLDNIIERETQNAPPYRGAMGYAPQIDTKEEMFSKSVLPYSSPYDLLLEIIQEQFQAQVVAVILENTSLFPGTLVVEGAIVLRREGGPPQTITMYGGETIEVMDEDPNEDYGNKGITAGTTYIVECASEEAIGIALACGSNDMPISVERRIWSDVKMDVTLDPDAIPKVNKDNGELESVMETIPPVKELRNSENSVQVLEGGEALVGGTNKKQQQQKDKSKEQDNKDDDDDDDDDTSLTVDSIQFVEEYDDLTILQKARMILSSGRLEDGRKLPRPRVLRTFEQNLLPSSKTRLSPLDELLLPMLGSKLLFLELLLRDSQECQNLPMVEKYQIDIEELTKKQKEDEEKKKKSWWK